MPANFPEVWSSRVIQLLTTKNVAPWLDGIAELDTEVIEMGSGTAGEVNLIHLPVETFQPEVLLNNSTYPIAVQEFTDTEVIIKLDKYQTLATSLSDDQITEYKNKMAPGYEGSFDGWLIPFVKPSYTVGIYDKDYPYKDGRYYVESVTTSFSDNGGKRTITPGIKLSK